VNPETLKETTAPSLDVVAEIDAACDRFEAEWRAGGRPRIEAYLAAACERARGGLLAELLRVEIAHRAAQGETLLTQDYTPRFPEHASLIDTLLARGHVAGPAHPVQAGRYRIKRFLAGGGMGLVYRAHDPDLRRPLAVKVLREEFKDEPALVARFLAEARITGQLQHPGIPPVHEIGQLPDGRPFLAMKLIEGRTLADLLAAPRDAADGLARLLPVYEQVCQILAYAHARGVIHRDLKPANVMVGAFAEVQVMDWGLAKSVRPGADRNGEPGADPAPVPPRTQHETLSGPTVPGAVMGTLAFMPPEQARGEVDRLDERSDVFGLGAILCVLLTGHPPYRERAHGKLLDQAQSADLADALTGLEGCGADAELVRLAKRCLAKEPADRPRNAAAVAQAMAAYQEGVRERLRQAQVERVRAEVVAREERKRRRMLLTASGIVALVLLAGLGGSLWQLRRAMRAEAAANTSAEQARLSAEEAKANEAAALQKERLQRRRAYFVRINAAQRALEQKLVAPALRLLEEAIPRQGEEDFRGFEWHYLDRQCHRDVLTIRGHAGWVWSVRYNPDGTRLATAGQDGTVRIWDAATGREIRTIPYPTATGIPRVAYSPDGKRVAAASDGQPLKVWDAATGQEVLSLADGGTGIAYSPDGHLLARGRHAGVAILDATTGAVVQTLADPPGYPRCLAFSPDGKTLATSGRDIATDTPAVKVWDLAAGKVRHTLLGHRDFIQSVAFEPSGTVLASGSADQTVRLWDAATGRQLHVLKGEQGDVYDVAFSPSSIWLGEAAGSLGLSKGLVLASCHYNFPDADDTPRVVTLWEPLRGQEIATFKGHMGTVTSLTFSPRNGQLASASFDGTVRIWDLARIYDATNLVGSGYASAEYLACSRQGRVFAWGTAQFVQVCDLASQRVLLNAARQTTSLALSSNGKVLATIAPPLVGAGNARGEITIWDLPAGVALRKLAGPPGFLPGGQSAIYLCGLALSPDGKLLASVSPGETIQVRETSTGNEICSFPAPGGAVSLAFGPGGRRLAAACGYRTVRLWDLDARREHLVLPGDPGDPWRVAFSPNGGLLAIAYNDLDDTRMPVGGVIHIRDTADGKEVLVLRGHQHYVTSVAFHPDGSRLVSGSYDQTAKIWDLETGQEVLTLGNHAGGIHGVAFTGDGTGILTAQGNIPSSRIRLDLPRPRYGVKFWTAVPWSEPTSPPASLTHRGRRGAHDGPVTCVACSPDGRQVLSGGFDRQVDLWDVEQGVLLRRLSGHGHVVWTVAFSPDGRRGISGSEDRTLRLWDLKTGQQLQRLEGHRGVISSVAFLPDGRHVISGAWDGTARLWDLETAKEVGQFKTVAPVLSLALTRDGKHVLFGSNDGKLRYWDVRTRTEVRAFPGPANYVEGVALTGDGQRAMASAADGLIHVYDAASGREGKPLRGHTAKVDCVVLSPDGSRVLSCGEDKTVRLWDLATGRELARGYGSAKVRWVAFSPDGRHAVSACYDGAVGWWELPR
jgi:WD40 repeat protein